MATAWAGSASGVQDSTGIAIMDDQPTAIATIGPVSTNEVNFRVWIHALVQLAANADVTGVIIELYRGDIATGTQIARFSAGADAFAGDGAPIPLDAIDDLSGGAELTVYTLALTMTGSSGESDASPIVLVATVF